MYRWFPFLTNRACCEACGNLKAAFLVAVVGFASRTAIWLYLCTITHVSLHECPSTFFPNKFTSLFVFYMVWIFDHILSQFFYRICLHLLTFEIISYFHLFIIMIIVLNVHYRGRVVVYKSLLSIEFHHDDSFYVSQFLRIYYCIFPPFPLLLREVKQWSILWSSAIILLDCLFFLWVVLLWWLHVDRSLHWHNCWSSLVFIIG